MRLDPRTNPPVPGAPVTVCGIACGFRWEAQAVRLDYKLKPKGVAAFHDTDRGVWWRFIGTEDGERIAPRDVESWGPADGC